jgi:hypothetical protein
MNAIYKTPKPLRHAMWFWRWGWFAEMKLLIEVNKPRPDVDPLPFQRSSSQPHNGNEFNFS